MGVRYVSHGHGTRCWTCHALPGACECANPSVNVNNWDARVVEIHPRLDEWVEWKSSGSPGGTDGYKATRGFDIVEYAVGAVVAEDGYRDVRVMSDVWEQHRAFVFAMPGGSFKVATVPAGAEVEVDAAELEPAYEAWKAEQGRLEAARRAEAYRLQREAEAAAAEREPIKGCLAKVVRGRKVPKGTVGEVIWTGSGNYGERVGLATVDGVVWTAASNVERIADGEALCGHADCAEDRELHSECNRARLEAITRTATSRARSSAA